MPQYHNNILCVTVSELEECGLSAGYLKRALAGQRKGEVYCWAHHKEGKRVYIHYNDLKEGYKTLIKVKYCGGSEPDVYLKNKEAEKAREQIDDLADQLTALVHADPDELKYLMSTQLYTPTEVQQLARAAGWLRLIVEYDVKRARKLGFESIDTLRTEIFKRCLNEQRSGLVIFKKGLITNERTLYANAVKYKHDGIRSLIHAGAGNTNRQKATKFSHAKLIGLASNQVKFSFEDIGMMYNDWAVSNDHEELTVEAIKSFLNRPPVKRIWFYARHGKQAADNEMQQLMNREKPSFPDAMWSLDGTTMQLYYRDDKGKICSDLYAYFVSDAHTGAIIGSSIAFAETSAMVDAALRDAINTHGYKPYQLQYDNSSANVSGVIKNLMTNMARVHFPCEPYKGRGKYVEGVIGHFQQRVLRKSKFFKGGNVDVKSLNSKANPELLAEFTKNPSLLLSRTEVLDEFNAAINDWNSRGEQRDKYGRFVGQGKLERYTSIEHEKRVKLNYFDRISLFFVAQKEPLPYTTEGIRIEIGGKKYKYRVPDADSVGDFMFANNHLGEKFVVRMDRENPAFVLLYQNGKFVAEAYEMDRYAAAVADLKEGEKAKQMLFKQKQDEFGHKLSIRELERQQAILGELQATGTEGTGWYDTPKILNNKRESALEDAANGVGDGMTERQRRILNIGR